MSWQSVFQRGPFKLKVVSANSKKMSHLSYTHLDSFMIRSMSSPTRSTNSRSLLLSASMIVGSASIWSSILLSVSGDGLDAKKGEGT